MSWSFSGTAALIASMALAAGAMAEGPEAIKMRGGSFANWWTLGEQIAFKDSAKKFVLPEGSKLTGEILDSEGLKLEELSVDAAQFNKEGWSWKPKTPGFYQIKFYYLDASGGRTPLSDSYHSAIYKRVNDVDKPKLYGERDFSRDVHNVAVIARPPREPADVPAQVGISVWLGRNDEEIKAARLIGSNFLRVQMNWSRLEPKQGEFDLAQLDALFKAGELNGFKETILNPYGTPRWASSHPERNEMNICVWGWESFAPAKLETWTKFLSAMIKRYPQVKEWELWNEPHLPGQSCFWQDTPENYVALLKAGYETVKRERPGATVLLGGVGMRYLPFYDRIIKGGAASYFDVLPLHGRWPSPEPFARMDSLAGVASKPWESSEWHAMLLNQSDPVPTEETLARNMLLDFMNQIRLGAGKVAIFTMLNLYKVEKETLAFHKEHNDFTHVSGFFRVCPYLEPRIQALIWRNFIDLFSGKIAYLEGYSFASGAQRASLLESASGKALLFWQAGKTDASPIDPELLKAAGPGSKLTDWEGRELAPKPGFMLHPERIYFLRNPDMAEVSKWTSKEQVLHLERGAAPELETLRYGLYRPGKLMDAKLETVEPEKLRWHEIGTYVPMDGKPKAEGFAAKFASSFDEGGMDLLVEVQDKAHVQACTTYGGSWNGDSVQFAIDAAGKGYPEDRLEVATALTSSGPGLWKGKMPSVQGDIPARNSPEGGEINYGSVKIERAPGRTLYKIRIDRDDLYPFPYLKGQPVRFSILVNNNDGEGRAGYLEWASGIGKSKEPAQYGTLTVEAGRKTLFEQSSLKNAWGSATVELKGETARVDSSGGGKQNAAAIATPRATPEPGVRFLVSFEARGDVPLQGMLTLFSGNDKGTRLDFLAPTPLEKDWRKIESSVVVPPGFDALQLSLFCWRQDGFFEIRGFKMETPPN